MVGSQDTPPSVQDGPLGYEPDGEVSFDLQDDDDSPELDMDTAQKLARDCYSASTNWVNSGKRARWTESLRAFQSLHPIDSKYYSRDYGYRTNLFRPKSRAMVRKAEAQTAAAFFSNEDVVNIEPQDEDNPQQAASAELLKALLQFRLTKTIPWFLTLIGARQDCEVMGLCGAKTYWKYEERSLGRSRKPAMDPHTGALLLDDQGRLQMREEEEIEKIHDKPVIDLIAMENLRFEPGADWRNVAQESPYLIYQIPMYVSDILAMMKRPESEGGWIKVAASALRTQDLDDDTTRRAREPGRVPGKDSDSGKPRDFDIGWVHENIIRWGGKDWHFFSLGAQATMLTTPRPLSEVYLHGVRPFQIGFVVVETHKTYPTSKVELVRDLQRASNDDWNLRFDSVKLALQPRQFVRQAAGLEITDVRTFMPGKVVVTQNPKEDIVWDRPPEPGASAYQEQDRINLDFDELVGDFSNSSVHASQVQEQSATGMNLMSGQASGMNEYELRVFAESFVEPVMRQLVKLEQAYETDQTVLAVCGKKAKLLQKFGVDQITDALLDEEADVKVNVGIGATNPSIKLRNFMGAAEGLQKMFGPVLAQGINFEEIVKEVFSLAGYKDGDRFFVPGFDFQAAVKQAQAMQGGKGAQHAPPDPTKVQAAQIVADGKIKEREIAAQSDMQLAQMEAARDAAQDKAENMRAFIGHAKDLIAPHVAPARPEPHPALRGAFG